VRFTASTSSGEQIGDVGFLGHIGRDLEGNAALAVDSGGDLGEHLLTARRQYGFGAFRRKRLSDRLAESAAGAGDDRDLVLQLFAHGVPPPYALRSSL
jgi:hypothetical protein